MLHLSKVITLEKKEWKKMARPGLEPTTNRLEVHTVNRYTTDTYKKWKQNIFFKFNLWLLSRGATFRMLASYSEFVLVAIHTRFVSNR